MGFVLEEAVIQLGIQGMSSIGSELGGLKSKLSGMFSGGMMALAGGAGVTALFGVAISKALAAEEGASKMKSALEANGQAVGPATAKFNELARSINNATGESKGHTKELLTSAVNMGLNADQAASYTKAAIGLARATGTDANTALKALTEAGHGNTRALQGLSADFKGVTDQAQLMAMAQDKSASGMKQGAADSETIGGKWEKLQQTVGGLLSKLGGMLLPIIDAVVDGLGDLIGTFTDAGDTGTSSVDGITASTSGMGEMVKTVAGWIKGAFQWMGWQFHELGNTAAIVWVGLLVGLSGFWDFLSNTFHNAVAIVKWFFTNFTSIFSDLFRRTIIGFENLGFNIKLAIEKVWAWIKGSAQPKEAFKGLYEGFVAETEAIPDLVNSFQGSQGTERLKAELTGLMQQRDNDAADFDKKQSDREQKRKDQKDKDIKDTQKVELGELEPHGKEKKEGKGAGFSDLISIWKNLQTSAMKQNDPQHQTLAENKKQTALGMAQLAVLNKIAGKKPHKTVAG